MASRASSSWPRSSRRMPVMRSTRRRNSGPFSARRQASVATQRTWVTRCRSSRWRQLRRAAMVRAMAASLSRLLAARPSPRRTMREKLSTTRNPVGSGTAISRRQLLVPRSSAASLAPWRGREAPPCTLRSRSSCCTVLMCSPRTAIYPAALARQRAAVAARGLAPACPRVYRSGPGGRGMVAGEP